jgi:hypothetical protein
MRLVKQIISHQGGKTLSFHPITGMVFFLLAVIQPVIAHHLKGTEMVFPGAYWPPTQVLGTWKTNTPEILEKWLFTLVE